MIFVQNKEQIKAKWEREMIFVQNKEKISVTEENQSAFEIKN